MSLGPLNLNAETARPLAMLRKLVRQASAKAVVERCELCSAPLAAEHQHLIEPASRRIVCSCDACAVLFDGRTDGRYRRVPRRARLLADFAVTDAQWDELLIPINMAFFFHSSPADKVVAIYPSPAGPMESLLPLDAWQTLLDANPVLRSMQPDVEALLANRLGHSRGFDAAEYYLAPIDECYKLVGVIRASWRGLSGGVDAWREISGFFTRLKAQSVRVTTGGSQPAHSGS